MATRRTTTKTQKKTARKRAAPKKAAGKEGAPTEKKAAAKPSTRRRTTKRVERIDPTPVKTAPPVLTIPKPLTRVFAPITEQPTEAPTEAPKGELITFAPDEWIALTYEGESMFCHPQAGVFVRGTTTRLRGSIARELAADGQFKARRAA